MWIKLITVKHFQIFLYKITENWINFLFLQYFSIYCFTRLKAGGLKVWMCDTKTKIISFPQHLLPFPLLQETHQNLYIHTPILFKTQIKNPEKHNKTHKDHFFIKKDHKTMEGLGENDMKQRLQELQRQLGKKQMFEEAVSTISSLLILYYPPASPSIRNLVWPLLFSWVCMYVYVLFWFLDVKLLGG